LKINIHPYTFIRFVKTKGTEFLSFCKDKEDMDDYRVADQSCFAILVQHIESYEIGLMLLKIYLWKKPGDEDYKAP
jgi:hypothetical protein